MILLREIIIVHDVATGYEDKETQTDLRDLQLDLQENRQLVQIGPNNYNVDFKLDKDFLALAKQGGNVKLETEGRRILTLTWNGVKETVGAIKSSVKLKFHQIMTELFGEFIEMFNNPNRFELFKTLVNSMKEKFNASLEEICSGSLIFIFTHQDRESVSKMVRDKEDVEEIFRTFVTKCLNTSGEIQIEVIPDYESPGGRRDSIETKDDSLKIVEARLADLTQQMTLISGDIRSLAIQTKASIYGMAELGAQVAMIAQGMGRDGDTERRFRESRGRESGPFRYTESQARIHDNKPTRRDRFEGPLHDQAEKLQIEAPRLTGEKESDDSKFSLSTYKEDSESKSEGNWTESSKSFEDVEHPIHSIKVECDSPALRRCIDEALLREDKPTPRSDDSMDTLLCIDVSGSIGEEGLKKVKGIAEEIVDGIQKVAEEHSLEENIGVISMGSDVRIVQRPTNDYSQVFDAIADLSCGGRSPIYTALCVCVAAMDGRSIAMSQFHRIPPRVIFITDGLATNHAVDTGPDNSSIDDDTKIKIIQLVTQFVENERVPCPIVWVPVGQTDKSKNFLQSLADIGKGKIVEEGNISSLHNYYRMQESIGRIYFCVKNDDRRGQDVADMVQYVTRAFIGDMTEAEQKFVMEAVKAKLEKKDEVDPDKSPNDFTHIHEVSSLPPVGTRVVRGEGWNYGDQDSGGPGTIINHSKDENHVLVMWDVSNTLGRYSYGADGRYDLNIIQEARELKKDELIEIGVTVNRGSDWTQGNVDGGAGNCGVVVRKRDDGMVKVRWTNGKITPCKYGFEGKMELEICQSKKPVPESSTTEKVTTKASSTQSSKPALKEVIEKPSPETPHVFWRWRDDLGQWRLYSKEATVKLDENYLKGGRSCLVKKGNDSCRVIFQKPFHERGIQGGTKRDVERILVNDMRRDELISLEVAIDDRSSWIS